MHLRPLCYNITSLQHSTISPSHKIRMARDVGGRPSIDLYRSGLYAREVKAVDYNVSHQGGYGALVGDTKGSRRVGVDIVISQFSPGLKDIPKDESWLDDFDEVFSQDDILLALGAKGVICQSNWNKPRPRPSSHQLHQCRSAGMKVQVHGQVEPWSFGLEEVDEHVWIATCVPRSASNTPLVNSAGTKGKWREVTWEDVVRGEALALDIKRVSVRVELCRSFVTIPRGPVGRAQEFHDATALVVGFPEIQIRVY
ncbi:hypothetical protein G7K_5774-t1 [Saitoella complicata NRRL Y-17804]|uniref:Uncharacterized protein n=1 Tax=Saitoella complicata (strain BCRC 22490 / CBS 7301 / JCM 7358 / NBRC 10748 / NRRL Y-17804) TaxID=698492 RepID=A0A0E9NPS0_SAICN|nr:hypothetical protein G7K_5774-t1 [Saitoella complicata NRRL Y-17804]